MRFSCHCSKTSGPISGCGNAKEDTKSVVCKWYRDPSRFDHQAVLCMGCMAVHDCLPCGLVGSGLKPSVGSVAYRIIGFVDFRDLMKTPEMALEFPDPIREIFPLPPRIQNYKRD